MNGMAVKITLLIWVFTGIVTSMYLLYKTPKITRSMEITGIAKGGLILLFAIFYSNRMARRRDLSASQDNLNT
jgi:hypothetical protein